LIRPAVRVLRVYPAAAVSRRTGALRRGGSRTSCHDRGPWPEGRTTWHSTRLPF